MLTRVEAANAMGRIRSCIRDIGLDVSRMDGTVGRVGTVGTPEWRTRLFDLKGHVQELTTLVADLSARAGPIK